MSRSLRLVRLSLHPARCFLQRFPKDPVIVLTANVFAILGLRALYFLLADLADRFHLLAYGLALVLVFIGGKLLLLDIYKIPIEAALTVTATAIAASIALSVWSSRKTLRRARIAGG